MFSKGRGMKMPSPGTNPIDFFCMLLEKDLMNFIIEETNRNAVTVLSLSTSKKARISAWKELTIDEFKISLALLYQMGSIQLSRIEDYWKSDCLTYALFREEMSRNRFLLILKSQFFFRAMTKEI